MITAPPLLAGDAADWVAGRGLTMIDNDRLDMNALLADCPSVLNAPNLLTTYITASKDCVIVAEAELKGG